MLDMLLEHYHDTGVEVIKHTAAIAPKEFHISEEDDIADFNFELDGWRNDFMKIESADVAPVRHGRWMDMKGFWMCSECHKDTLNLFSYCPYCGAKMDEEENDGN